MDEHSTSMQQYKFPLLFENFNSNQQKLIDIIIWVLETL